MMENASHSARALPIATYRLQFHGDFTLRRATVLVPYLAALGISHVYASPLLKAMPGSTHGYDTCDPTRINPEIGTEDDLAALVGILHRHRMGLVLDIVPNHMGVGGRHNPWWWDVLKSGRQSRFARVFDIDWNAPGLDGKVLLPVLGASYEEALSKGDLSAGFDHGESVLRYAEHEFPLVADTTPASPEELHAILQRQHYRLVHWRRGNRELNYRRFFTITSLAGVRAEDPEVFRMTHELLLRWYDRGWIDGFRVDHPDGLRDPETYLEQLRHHAPHAWITVEKILTGNEMLPEDWPVDGTTGYDFLNRETHLLIDPEGEPAVTEFYESFTGEPADFDAMAREAKREVVKDSLAAEVSQLLRMLPGTADRDSLIEFIACFPVYRTYVHARRIRDEDRRRIDQAATLARTRSACDAETLEMIRKVLLGETDPPHADEFTARFQQLTGPAMAKGLEDRAFYRFNRLVALNEVGGEPACFGSSVATFHQSCIDTVPRWSGSMLGSSTHDTKRGEDVRARLCLLAEIPDRWAATVREWSDMNASHRQGPWPDRNAEYLFYQTLVGAWPLSAGRAAAYMEKAAREAAQWTAWTAIHPAYEEALATFVIACLADTRFTTAVEVFVQPLLDAAWTNSLTLTLLKLIVPGIPDIYQGTELWDLSLVDPDNRRAVDFELRQRLITEMQDLSPEQVWQRRPEGLPKLWTIQRALAVRQARPESFARAAYRPLTVTGAKATHALAFMRSDDVIGIVPRLPLGRGRDWDDAHLNLPEGAWRNVFTDESVSGGNHRLAGLLRRFPVALLVRHKDPS